MDNLEKAFLHRGVVRGGLLLLQPSEAIELVKVAARAGRRVVGVDGFVLGGESTQPIMEHSIDLSDEPHGGWARAEHFLLAQLGTRYYFEIILG